MTVATEDTDPVKSEATTNAVSPSPSDHHHTLARSLAEPDDATIVRARERMTAMRRESGDSARPHEGEVWTRGPAPPSSSSKDSEPELLGASPDSDSIRRQLGVRQARIPPPPPLPTVRKAQATARGAGTGTPPRPPQAPQAPPAPASAVAEVSRLVSTSAAHPPAPPLPAVKGKLAAAGAPAAPPLPPLKKALPRRSSVTEPGSPGGTEALDLTAPAPAPAGSSADADLQLHPAARRPSVDAQDTIARARAVLRSSLENLQVQVQGAASATVSAQAQDQDQPVSIGSDSRSDSAGAADAKKGLESESESTSAPGPDPNLNAAVFSKEELGASRTVEELEALLSGLGGGGAATSESNRPSSSPQPSQAPPRGAVPGGGRPVAPPLPGSMMASMRARQAPGPAPAGGGAGPGGPPPPPPMMLKARGAAQSQSSALKRSPEIIRKFQSIRKLSNALEVQGGGASGVGPALASSPGGPMTPSAAGSAADPSIAGGGGASRRGLTSRTAVPGSGSGSGSLGGGAAPPSVPTTGSGGDPLVNELQSRSKYLVQISRQAVAFAPLLRALSAKITAFAPRDLAAVASFVERVDQILGSLSDERAVLKRVPDFNETRLERLREAAGLWHSVRGLCAAAERVVGLGQVGAPAAGTGAGASGSAAGPHVQRGSPAQLYEAFAKECEGLSAKLTAKIEAMVGSVVEDRKKFEAEKIPFDPSLLESLKRALVRVAGRLLRMTLEAVATSESRVRPDEVQAPVGPRPRTPRLSSRGWNVADSRGALQRAIGMAFRTHQVVGGVDDATLEAFVEAAEALEKRLVIRDVAE